MHRAKDGSIFLRFSNKIVVLECLKSVGTLMDFVLRRALVKPFLGEHQKSATGGISSSSLQLKRKEPFEVLNN